MRKKILCLDVGAKIIGVAVSDAFGTVAFPRDEMRWGGDPAQLVSALKKFAENEGNPTLVVLGSLHPNAHPSMRSATAAVADILEQLALPVLYIDEHVSTQEAANRIADTEEETGIRFPLTRRDSVAAQIILERYLASL